MEAILILVAIQAGSALIGGIFGSTLTGLINHRIQKKNRVKIQQDIEKLRASINQNVPNTEPMESEPFHATVETPYNEPYRFTDLRV